MSSTEAVVRERLADALREREEQTADRWVRLRLRQGALGVELDARELREEADLLVSALADGLAGDEPVDRPVAGRHDLTRTRLGEALSETVKLTGRPDPEAAASR
ncbi:hypothetical protein [Streptomyces sp. NPDC060194]|uniref:hypothetical protein n=1 Tax=Streptomyces sp. NPDC060194 TaxID=3347069 RepID=UPI0036697D5F